jgi:hypothetical protein
MQDLQEFEVEQVSGGDAPSNPPSTDPRFYWED